MVHYGPFEYLAGFQMVGTTGTLNDVLVAVDGRPFEIQTIQQRDTYWQFEYWTSPLNILPSSVSFSSSPPMETIQRYIIVDTFPHPVFFGSSVQKPQHEVQQERLTATEGSWKMLKLKKCSTESGYTSSDSQQLLREPQMLPPKVKF